MLEKTYRDVSFHWLFGILDQGPPDEVFLGLVQFIIK